MKMNTGRNIEVLSEDDKVVNLRVIMPAPDVDAKAEKSKGKGNKSEKCEKLSIATINEVIEECGHTPLTERGSATRAASIDGEHLRYCLDDDKFRGYERNDGVWNINKRAGRNAIAKVADYIKNNEFIELMDAIEEYRKNAKWLDDRRVNEIVTTIKSYCNSHGSDKLVSAAEKFLKDVEGLHIRITGFDPDRHLINCQNGYIDVRDGKLFKHDPAKLFSKQMRATFKNDAKCPTWERFLDDVFQGDAELIHYMKVILGSLLSGEIKAEEFYFFFGVGANGKSVLLKVLMHMMGSYAYKIPTSVLTSKDSGNGKTDALAQLIGRRLIVANELTTGATWDEETLKNIASSDEIAARALYASNINYMPTGKMIVAGNHQPNVKDTSNAMWRRFRPVPFDVVFEGERRDEGLYDKLISEASGILNWMIEGCIEWYQRNGKIQLPKRIEEEASKYRDNMDYIKRFFDDECQTGGKYYSLPSDVHRRFLKWASIRNEEWLTRMGERVFKDQMSEKGWKPQPRKLRDGTSVRVYVGLKLKETSWQLEENKRDGIRYGHMFTGQADTVDDNAERGE